MKEWTLKEYLNHDTKGTLTHNLTVRVPVVLEFKVDWFNDERIDYDGDGVATIDKDGNVTDDVDALLIGCLDAWNDLLESARGDIMCTLEKITLNGKPEFEEGPDYKETIKMIEEDRMEEQ